MANPAETLPVSPDLLARVQARAAATQRDLQTTVETLLKDALRAAEQRETGAETKTGDYSLATLIANAPKVDIDFEDERHESAKRASAAEISAWLNEWATNLPTAPCLALEAMNRETIYP